MTPIHGIAKETQEGTFKSLAWGGSAGSRLLANPGTSAQRACKRDSLNSFADRGSYFWLSTRFRLMGL